MLQRRLQIGIGLEIHPLPGLDQEIDDLADRHVEQRRQFGSRRDQRIEVDLRRREIDAQVARTMAHRPALDQSAAHEMIDADRFGRRFDRGRLFKHAHATPRT